MKRARWVVRQANVEGVQKWRVTLIGGNGEVMANGAGEWHATARLAKNAIKRITAVAAKAEVVVAEFPE